MKIAVILTAFVLTNFREFSLTQKSVKRLESKNKSENLIVLVFFQANFSSEFLNFL